MSPLPYISGFLHEKQGFCHPDWDAIAGVIEKDVPEDEWRPAWVAVARAWVTRNRELLGGDYQVYETENFLILSAAPLRIIRDACKSYEDALKQIVTGLGDLAWNDGYGKRVVLMFATQEDYYGYIHHFYPEGDHPMSGGVCLSSDGYLHFAFPTVEYLGYRTILVHELTHGCLHQLPIPSWLNEAVAMRMQEAICGTQTFHLDKETYNRHLAHWDAETIQQFWSGESWAIPGDSFELSYNLAQVLWRKIEVDLSAPRPAILEFIAIAHRDDAGEAACQSLFELGLADLVTDFLGEGPWEPDPGQWRAETASNSQTTPEHE